MKRFLFGQWGLATFYVGALLFCLLIGSAAGHYNTVRQNSDGGIRLLRNGAVSMINFAEGERHFRMENGHLICTEYTAIPKRPLWAHVRPATAEEEAIFRGITKNP